MENRLVNGLVIGLIIIVVAGTPRCIATPALRLTLVIYDHAHVRTETLAAAENTVSEIFGHANVQLTWRDGFAYAAERYGVLNPAPDDPATLVVKLQPESQRVLYGVRSVCAGIGFPSGAIVFVRSFDARSTISDATRLGYVIAHELGHMLLGPNAHAIVGIMRGTLLPEDWEKAAQGTLGFTHSQSQQIRMWIDQRTSTGDRTLSVLVLDYAGLPDSSLNEMESLSGLLLSRAGIRTQWVHCLGHQAYPRPALCDKILEPGSILIRILKTPIGSQNGLGDRVGSARIESRYASLNASEISKYAEHNELPADSLMAYAMTHEIRTPATRREPRTYRDHAGCVGKSRTPRDR